VKAKEKEVKEKEVKEKEAKENEAKRKCERDKGEWRRNKEMERKRNGVYKKYKFISIEKSGGRK
jgi:hypothetical protein